MRGERLFDKVRGKGLRLLGILFLPEAAEKAVGPVQKEGRELVVTAL
jgi:hypothetical protein